ncbi:MAG: hypothetical protein NVS1B11_06750 [Terriglobales bacterium]
MKTSTSDRAGRENVILAQVLAGVSVLSFFFYLQHGDLLLYGDAVAHVNIARRVFDSRTPGLLQLGTVWLPLPQLLMVPLLFPNRLWQTGIGGSIPSMIAYILGSIGIFRLVQGALSYGPEPDIAARAAAWTTVVIYAGNPNLIYLQSTAMTESLSLALFIWAVVFFLEFARGISITESADRSSLSRLIKCGLCIFGACLTRYDGWFLACVLVVGVFGVALRHRAKHKRLFRNAVMFFLLAAAGPVLWLAYNAAVYRNPLEFANGPYSAKAIQQRDLALGHSVYPGFHDIPVAFSFFVKCAELNLAPKDWGRLWLAVLLAAVIVPLRSRRRLYPLLMLGVPIPFYALSIAFSGVPIYLPTWWPFSFYNMRYGLELLPAFAVGAGSLVNFALISIRSVRAKIVVLVVTVICVAGSYTAVWYGGPVCFQEAWINSRDRIPMEASLAGDLKKLPSDSTLLMYLGNHVGALQQAGIPLVRVINEGNHRPWKTPSDEQGLWERALASPETYADYVIASQGDLVDRSVNKSAITPVAVIHAKGEPSTTIYWSHRSNPLR